jgi:hypothetical protein
MENRAMARRSLIPILCVIAATLTWSCEADRVTPPPPADTSVKYKNLQQKDNVLYNLELAYNERNTAEFEKLLDGDFVFVFSQADYSGGEVGHRLWGEASEVDANRKLLDPNLEGDKRVLSIDLSLDYAEDAWVAEAPNEDHPGQTWYTKAVEYNLVTKTADDWEHRALGQTARIAIRQDDSTGQWRIVEWRDGAGGGTALSPAGGAVESTTWGRIKWLYCSQPFEDLSSMEDVLYNLELAYDQRDSSEFVKLLDDDFVFIFSPEDYSSGQTPQQWDRASEVGANQNLLDPNLPEDWRATDINLRLDYPPGSWTVEAPNQNHPAESWYTKTVGYQLVLTMADGYKLRTLSLQAQFTIRWSASGEDGGWQVVLWRDDTGSSQAFPNGIWETTWGQIKHAYLYL